jgi:hypothetical protein
MTTDLRRLLTCFELLIILGQISAEHRFRSNVFDLFFIELSV